MDREKAEEIHKEKPHVSVKSLMNLSQIKPGEVRNPKGGQSPKFKCALKKYFEKGNITMEELIDVMANKVLKKKDVAAFLALYKVSGEEKLTIQHTNEEKEIDIDINEMPSELRKERLLDQLKEIEEEEKERKSD